MFFPLVMGSGLTDIPDKRLSLSTNLPETCLCLGFCRSLIDMPLESLEKEDLFSSILDISISPPISYPTIGMTGSLEEEMGLLSRIEQSIDMRCIEGSQGFFTTVEEEQDWWM